MLSYKKDIHCVYEHDNVSDFSKLANKTRYSYYPTLNENDECTGIIRVSDITYENKRYWLGTYSDINDAINARKAKERELFGEYQYKEMEATING